MLRPRQFSRPCELKEMPVESNANWSSLLYSHDSNEVQIIRLTGKLINGYIFPKGFVLFVTHPSDDRSNLVSSFRVQSPRLHDVTLPESRESGDRVRVRQRVSPFIASFFLLESDDVFCESSNQSIYHSVRGI